MLFPVPISFTQTGQREQDGYFPRAKTTDVLDRKLAPICLEEWYQRGACFMGR